MKNLLNIYQMWIREVIGKKLKGVNGLIYIFNTPDFDSPQQVQLTFLSKGQNASFRCGKDGASLEITYLPMKESVLGEYGKQVIIDISTSQLFYKYIGKVLSHFFVIYSDVEKTIIGVKLVFNNELDLLIINLGDEIKILDTLTLEFEQDEAIHYIRMPSV
ncbi:hypothetical protein AB7W40_13925 [Providencia rettgeri]